MRRYLKYEEQKRQESNKFPWELNLLDVLVVLIDLCFSGGDRLVRLVRSP